MTGKQIERVACVIGFLLGYWVTFSFASWSLYELPSWMVALGALPASLVPGLLITALIESELWPNRSNPEPVDNPEMST